MWIVPLALVALGVLGFVLLGGGGGPGGLLNHEDNSIPAFDFTKGKTTAIHVTDEKKTPPDVNSAASGVTTALTQLYTEAFLDPANWRDGSYDEVWPLFADTAAGAAQRDAATLTVGAGGGDTYEKIAEPKGTIDVKVLLDDKNKVATVVAEVRFSAVGTRKDGKLTLFRSSGQYFLRPGGDGWQVYSFSVNRDDAVRRPKPSASSSASGSSS